MGKHSEKEAKKENNSGLSIAATIFGILSLFMPCLVLSILAIVFGSQRTKEPMGKAGLVMGVISIVEMIIVVIVLVSVFACGNNDNTPRPYY